MRRVACLIILLLTPLAAAQDAPVYSEVQIHLPSRAQLAEVADLAALDHFHLEEAAPGWRIHAFVGERDLARLAEAGYAFDVLEADVTAAYAARAAACPGKPAVAPAGFFFGSMGCYPTWDETLAALEEMRNAYPHLIDQKYSIGQSWEGRELWVLRFTAAPDPEAVPEVLFTALHHAREPQSLASLLYTMYYVLENYGTDPEVTTLLENRALYFLPVLNPDGYVYNQQIAPAGGGMWRKNRRNNVNGNWGVDLNRNYGYEWGGSGSSGSPGSDIYRGPEPFSEPETAALRMWLQTRQIRAAFNYHSFSDLWLYPWGYAPNTYTPDNDIFAELAAEITRYNGYVYGTAADILYSAAGASDDWMYGEQGEKGKIFSYTPEIGSSSDGFWPNPVRIVPLSHGSLHPNLVLSWFVGAHPREVVSQSVEEAHPGNGYLDPGEEGVLHVSVENFGIGSLQGVRARVVDASGALVDYAPWSEAFDFPARETTALPPIPFTLSEDAPLGAAGGLALELEMESGTATLALGEVVIGTPVFLLNDPIDELGNWTLNHWGITTDAHSPPYALTDSPLGPYLPETTNTLRLRDPIDLSEVGEASLRFHARWDIRSDVDFLQVRASTNNSVWTPLAGNYTVTGSGQGVQPAGQPGYAGRQLQWVAEEIDLTPLAGEPSVYLQFRMRSHTGPTADGFTLDDVQVVAGYYDGSGSVASGEGASRGVTALASPYPNPVRGVAHFRFALQKPAEATLTVYDMLGRPVARLAEGPHEAGAHVATWDASGGGVAAGLYVVELRAAGEQVTRRVAVVR